MPPVGAPFQDVADHVMQAKGIRGLLPHWMRPRTGVLVLFLLPDRGIEPAFVFYAAVARVPGNGIQLRSVPPPPDGSVP